MNKFEHFASLLPKLVGSFDGAISPAITNSASFAYGNSKNAEDIFSGALMKPVYSRMGNPTNAKLESILATIDGGVGAVVTSSGMAALNLAILSICASGDEIIAIGGLFGGTYAMFKDTLSRYGIKTHFFDTDEKEAVEKAINKNTKVIFCESVGNPNMRLPDIKYYGDLSNKHKLCFMVDNTTTPIVIAPIELGADMVIYSTTKIMTGNASTLGGAVVFKEVVKGDKFHDAKYSFLEKFIEKAGKNALIMNAKKRVMRDFGFSANAFSSYLTMLGLETLAIRSQRISQNIEKFAKTLEGNGFVVRHPSLKSHEHHELYKNSFPYGCGMMMTVDMGTKEKACKFLDNLKTVFITANLGDCRTLGLHVKSTIYSDFSEEEREMLGITDGLIRLSIGLESVETLVEDFMQAKKSV